METDKARESIKKLTRDSSSLAPSAVLSLFEIDITELLKNNERSLYIEGQGRFAYYNQNTGRTVLRFHNNVKLFRSSIWFGKDSDNIDIEYVAAPIEINGYEISAKGSPPRPKMSISIDPNGLPQEVANRITYIKTAIRDLDDLIGAKVTRLRTFAKYINSKNFYDVNGNKISNALVAPEGFDPDPNAQFPPDIYYIDRKSAETVNVLELELASPFDTQDLKLPARVVNDFNCTWTYRGEGCCYEWLQQKDAIDSAYTKSDDAGVNHHHQNNDSDCLSTPNPAPNFGANPAGAAPPVATYNNELISNIIGRSPLFNSNNGQNEWDSNTTYAVGQTTRIKTNGINYYYVSKGSVNGKDNKGFPPPNETYWVADQCSKTIDGCRLRWQNNPEVGNISGPLPFGGFPTSKRAVK